MLDSTNHSHFSINFSNRRWWIKQIAFERHKIAALSSKLMNIIYKANTFDNILLTILFKLLTHWTIVNMIKWNRIDRWTKKKTKCAISVHLFVYKTDSIFFRRKYHNLGQCYLTHLTFVYVYVYVNIFVKIFAIRNCMSQFLFISS